MSLIYSTPFRGILGNLGCRDTHQASDIGVVCGPVMHVYKYMYRYSHTHTYILLYK